MTSASDHSSCDSTPTDLHTVSSEEEPVGTARPQSTGRDPPLRRITWQLGRRAGDLSSQCYWLETKAVTSGSCGTKNASCNFSLV